MNASLKGIPVALSIVLFSSSAFAQDWPDRSTLPNDLSPFGGEIGETYQDSTADWPEPVSAPDGAPNVIVILLDDVGFGQTSTFGGLIPTPNLDQLAEEGLKYTRLHTTAICGPTRAALLTGHNHHQSANGFLMEWATGFPSYSTMIPRNTATIGRILRDNGYATWWYGKNHNTPDWETTIAGPFDRWPTGLGFDYFYGFNAGETHQYYPVIFENTTPVEPDKSPEEGYHFLTDMTDRAIERMEFFKTIAPEKPFFMYFSTGSMHAPHHVTAEWREQFDGAFDMGWEEYREVVHQRQLDMGIIPEGTELTPRPDWVPAWDTLTDQQKELYTAFMENFAGYFAFTDHEIGRLLDAVEELPDAENTMVIYIVGDNDASGEGGPDGTLNEIRNLNGLPSSVEETLANIDKLGGPESEPHYPMGWAWAGNTPFQWMKQVASHLGGTRNPMVVTWPAQIEHDDAPREAFLHVIHVVPTILEAAGIPAPATVDGIEQKPIEGASFLASFDAPAFEGRSSQYFEIVSNRSMYADGWKANAQHTLPWRGDLAPGNWDEDEWELYNLEEDFSEANNLADQMPEKLKELKAEFEQAKEEFDILPLDDRFSARLAVPKPPVAGSVPGSDTYTYRSGAIRIPENAGPPMKNRSWTLTADVEVAGPEAEGVILASGGGSAGLVLYLDGGVPVFDYNYFDTHTVVKGASPLAAGEATIEIDFVYSGAQGEVGKGATVTLKVNGEQVAEGTMEATVPGRFGVDTFGIGQDTGQPVVFDYEPPFPFTGTIDQVTVKVSG